MSVYDIKAPELKEINDLFFVHGSLVNYEAWKYWQRIIENNLNMIDSNVADRFLIGRNMKSENIKNIRNKVDLLKKNMIKKFENYDFFILPTISFSPPSINAFCSSVKAFGATISLVIISKTFPIPSLLTTYLSR